MEQSPTSESTVKTTKKETRGEFKPEKPHFTMASILKNDGRWKVLGFSIEAWLLAFLVALALPYLNIVVLPVMFFVFAGALAVYTVWALFKQV